jgi:hypothetical protein
LESYLDQPEQLEFNMDLEEVSTKISLLLGFNIKITFDQTKHTATNDISQLKKNYEGILLNGFNCKNSNKEGLLYWFQQDSTNLETFKNLVKEMKIFGTPTYDKFKAPGCWYYDMFYQEGCLFIEVQGGVEYYTTDGFTEKFKWLLKNLPPQEVKKEENSVGPTLSKEQILIEKSLEGIIKFTKDEFDVPLSVDWNNCKIKKITSETYQWEKTMNYALKSHDDSFKKWFDKDAANKIFFKKHVKEISVFMTHEPPKETVGCQYIEMDLVNQKLVFILREGYGFNLCKE